jgi:mRNA-binding protein PUF3
VAELNTENRVTKCLRDQHGNHVIQKAIEVIPSPYIQFIYDALYGQIVNYSIHTFGCRVVQRMLEKQDEVLKSSVLQELSKCTPDLIMDSFGNYVAQHVIKHGDDANRNRMIGLVLNNVKVFARHKFASNVVEKCILHGTFDQQKQILDHVMSGSNEDGEKEGLIEYVKCAYGNYVIQSLLDNLPYHEGRTLCNALVPEVQKAKRTTPKKTIEGIEEKMVRFMTPNSSRPSSMHSNGVVSTPTSVTSHTSSVTSVGPCFSDNMDKTQSTYHSMSASPVEQNFGNVFVGNITTA